MNSPIGQQKFLGLYLPSFIDNLHKTIYNWINKEHFVQMHICIEQRKGGFIKL